MKMANKFKTIDADYHYIWPFSIIQYYNERYPRPTKPGLDLNDLSVNDIFNGYAALSAREAEIITRYIRDGETLDSLANVHGVTRARIGAIRDKALRVIVNRIRKNKAELKDKEDILNAMIAEKTGSKVDTPIFIDQLDLSIRATNCLVRSGIKTLDQLKKLDSYELLRIRNLGRGAYNEIVNKLDELGINHDFIPWASDMSPSAMSKHVQNDHILRKRIYKEKEIRNER